MNVMKKDNHCVPFDFNKIREAVKKSANRVNVVLSEDDMSKIEKIVREETKKYGQDVIPVSKMHNFVECALDEVNRQVAKAYRDYRNYKQDFVEMMDSVLKTADEMNYKIDRSNANTSAALVSTKRSLVYSALNKEIYKKNFLSKEELSAMSDGYIYIHDLSARLDSANCCLFDMGKVLQGGFEWEHIGYNEPKDVRTAGNLISDITLNCAAQQYGGFTLPEIDSIMAPYAEKSYNRYVREYKSLCEQMSGNYDEHAADQYAIKKVERDIAQVFQGFEHTFNTVASSRGDYPFITITGGCDETRFGTLVWSTALKVRREGQGHPGHKRPAIFPKMVFLYTKELHGAGKPLEWLFNEGVKTSCAAMYPDWLSLDEPDETLIKGVHAHHYEPQIANVFKKYHKFGVSRWYLDKNENVQENPEWVDAIISPMGCRAYLSAYYEKGGLKPASDEDKPIFTGRFNGGAISLNLPMIYEKSVEEKKNFYEVLDYYLDMINGLHIKTFDFLCKLKASCNPVGFCEGGFGKLKPTDNISSLVKRITFSYGFTALNELQELYNGKSLYEVREDDHAFAYEVLKYISNYVDQKKTEYQQGKLCYIAALYATPAESLCGTQREQFVKKYGVIHKVSDRAYFTNSFHMHVTEDITPYEKQDAEFRYFHIASGGHIQYCRFVSGMNEAYVKQCVRRAMALGYYFGVNIEKSYCEDCGNETDDDDIVCGFCGSHNLTTINRVCGYLGYSKVEGTTKMNDAKMAEVKDRKSM